MLDAFYLEDGPLASLSPQSQNIRVIFTLDYVYKEGFRGAGSQAGGCSVAVTSVQEHRQ